MKEKKDYRKDTLCTANVAQQKDCKNYAQHDGVKYPICKHWGLAGICEAE